MNGGNTMDGRVGLGSRWTRFRSPVVVLLAFLLLAACDPRREAPPGRQVPGGDSDRGKAALVAYGCGSCHSIPGVGSARGLAAGPLSAFAERAYVAGVLPNNADNLVAWIVNPQSINAATAMPNLGVRESDARDMAAYLYTLRRD